MEKVLFRAYLFHHPGETVIPEVSAAPLQIQGNQGRFETGRYKKIENLCRGFIGKKQLSWASNQYA